MKSPGEHTSRTLPESGTGTVTVPPAPSGSGDGARDVSQAGGRSPSASLKRLMGVAQVLLGFASVVVVVGAVVLSPRVDVARRPQHVIGTQELVRVTGPTGETVEVVARIDTGAVSSSIDDDLADRLGFDLENAETVTIASSLGREERPVVFGALQLAGEEKATRFNVADRSQRSNLVLVGRDDIRGFQVVVGQRLLSTPGEETAPSALRTLFSQGPALGPQSLLEVLPLAALIIVLLRVVVGLNTLGTFAPILLATGYTQAGLTRGLLITAVIFVVGVAVQPLLRRFRLPRVARLAMLIGLVVMVLLGLQEITGMTGAADSWGAALPVVVTAVMIERLWETWDLEGAGDAIKEALVTLAVAVLVTLLIVAPFTRLVAEAAPIAFALACTIWAGLAGGYRGLRLVELMRFWPAARRAVTGG